MLALGALSGAAVAHGSGLARAPRLAVKVSHGGQLTLARHGSTVDFTLKFSTPVTGIGLEFPSSTIAKEKGAGEEPDVDAADFSGTTGYCLFLGGNPDGLNCEKAPAKPECEPDEDEKPECTAQPIAAGSVIRGKISFTKLARSPSGHGYGYTAQEETIETKTVDFK